MYANITTNLENQKPINEIRSRNANQIMMVTRKKLQRALTHALLLTAYRCKSQSPKQRETEKAQAQTKIQSGGNEGRERYKLLERERLCMFFI